LNSTSSSTINVCERRANEPKRDVNERNSGNKHVKPENSGRRLTVNIEKTPSRTNKTKINNKKGMTSKNSNIEKSVTQNG
jgi:hypothetical protein